MTKVLPLQDELVIFTGILRSSEAVDMTLQFGGIPVVAPLIATQELISDDDEQKLLSCQTYDWLIFTSQSSVHAFHAKLMKYHVNLSSINVKIAVVGSKTACAVRSIGLKVHFIPSIFSADVFVKEFPEIATPNEKCLFFKGNLAKNTITDGLVNPIDEWIIYETIEVEENKEQVRSVMENNEKCSIIFTSPSAIEIFHKSIGSQTGYDELTVCAIGHITRDCLESFGANVQVMPDTYTLTEVIHTLVEWKGRE